MWAGYTGRPLQRGRSTSSRRRATASSIQTFPGGIHSGTDFYMNDAGILIGETTSRRRRWNPDGHAAEQPDPEGDRSTRSSIDEVARILPREEQRDVHERLDRSPTSRRTRRRSSCSGRTQLEALALDRPAGAVRDARLPLGEQQRPRRRGAARVRRSSPTTRRSTRRSARGTATSPSGGGTTEHKGRIDAIEAVRPLGLLADQPAARLRREGDDARDGREARLHGPLGEGDAAREVPRRGQPPDARPPGRDPAPDARLRRSSAPSSSPSS